MNRLLSGFAVSGCHSAEQFLSAYRELNPHIERVRPITPARVFAAIRAIDLPRSRLVVDAPEGVEVRGSAPSMFYVILPLGRGLEIDLRDRAPSAPFILPYDGFVSRISGPGDRVYFGLPRAFAESEIIGDRPEALSAARSGRLPAERLQLFQSQALRFIGAVDEAPSLVLSQQRFRAAQEELLFLALAHAFEEERDARPAVPLHYRRALDFIEAHFRDDIRLNDIAAAAGTSVRSLQSAFRAFQDTTPTGYIRERRLNFARGRLSRARAGDTVTVIALECGFNHLGEFSLHYRQRFGESPSDTLRQSLRLPPPPLRPG